MNNNGRNATKIDAARDDISNYYDDKYFNFQNDLGEFSGWAETMKFTSHISPGDTVIDFGCSGGQILKNIDCAKKIGVEINDTARAYAEKINNLTVVKYIDDLDDSIADIIISNHALEHCASPYNEIAKLLKKLKPGGRIIVYVPCESIYMKWTPGDVNNHLYTWNPMTLGNLFASAGYEVEIVKAVYHRWPPFYKTVAKFGKNIFNILSVLCGLVTVNSAQVKIVCRRSER